MGRFDAVIYDLDGTLLDTLAEIAGSCNAVLERHGHPVHPRDAYRYFIGDGVGTLVSRMLPETCRSQETFRSIAGEVEREYVRRNNAMTTVFDGIPALLDGQARRRIPMAILSNKPHALTLDCVRTFLSSWEFARIQGMEEGLQRKPSPEGALRIARCLDLEPASILYVGDTNVDMMTARAAGMTPVGVLWGFRGADELRASGARELADRPMAILDILDRD